MKGVKAMIDRLMSGAGPAPPRSWYSSDDGSVSAAGLNYFEVRSALVTVGSGLGVGRRV